VQKRYDAVMAEIDLKLGDFGEADTAKDIRL
jgi:hypothetical protein